mmetsp:Transcript_53239/g.124729  ORF Transcript_53239/g.124729 Transcript_53239/m.124729 type:complete len:89 (-) Transcript_53239:134-400(-)
MGNCCEWLSSSARRAPPSGCESGLGGRSQAYLDNHANQCNPNNSRYRGYDRHYSGSGTRADLNNHANQMNPNNDEYWNSRGQDNPNRR